MTDTEIKNRVLAVMAETDEEVKNYVEEGKKLGLSIYPVEQMRQQINDLKLQLSTAKDHIANLEQMCHSYHDRLYSDMR